MQVSIAEAEGKLAQLLQEARDGSEVILTEEGHAAAHLVPIHTQKSRRTLTEAGQKSRMDFLHDLQNPSA